MRKPVDFELNKARSYFPSRSKNRSSAAVDDGWEDEEIIRELQVERERAELRLDATTGRRVTNIPITNTNFDVKKNTAEFGSRKKPAAKRKRRVSTKRSKVPGIKKPKTDRNGIIDMPPTPWGCEWRETDDGWNLWKYWTEKNVRSGKRITRERYLGTLSRSAWNVLKGYDNEIIISKIGKRLRRHSRG